MARASTKRGRTNAGASSTRKQVLTATVVDHTPGAEAGRRFIYDATNPANRRKAPAIDRRAEDLILPPYARAQIQSNARDLARNFSIAAWMVRRHLDYVASFEFHSRTDDEGLNDQVENLVLDWAQPENFDAAGRHGLGRFIRIAEARAVLDGDIGILKLATGHVQGIESDRIRDPAATAATTTTTPQWTHGVKTDAAGRALAYAIHRRAASGPMALEREVKAENLILHGYYERFDQIRGVSPLSAALNPLRDVYENIDLALAKSKVEQLFALVFKRDAMTAAGVVTPEDETDERTQYRVDFGRGPVQLDLDPGDDAEFLQANTPGNNFQPFTEQVIQIALKALDIPFSFFSENFTNFFGSRGAWLHYQRACKPKREALQHVLTRLTRWRLMLALLDGRLELPAGKTLADIDFYWVPVGMPWWDPAKEIRGDQAAINSGLDYPQRVTLERGKGDFYDNLRQIKKAKDFAASLGLPLDFTPMAPEFDPAAMQPTK